MYNYWDPISEYNEYDSDQSDLLNDSFSDTLSDINQLDGNDSIITRQPDQINIINKTVSKSFKIIEANVNSLKGKKEELKALIDSEKPDCLVLVETKLDNSFNNSEFFDTNVWNVVVREDRNIYGGGVIIAVLRKYTASPVIIKYDNPSRNPELYWIKLQSFNRRKPVYICGFYRSQRDPRSKYDVIRD